MFNETKLTNSYKGAHKKTRR